MRLKVKSKSRTCEKKTAMKPKISEMHQVCMKPESNNYAENDPAQPRPYAPSTLRAPAGPPPAPRPLFSSFHCRQGMD